jgi:DNA protecting protein DprA
MTEDDFLIWFSIIPNLTLKRQNVLLNYFGSARDVWYASENILRTVGKIPKSVLDNVITYKDESKISTYKKLMEKNKIRFISKFSPLYPKLLRQIADSPNGFYVLGDLPDDSLSKVAIVGSRKYTEYGAYAAQKLSYDLSLNNIVIVSGMARGIDSVAHKAVIRAGGKTIAVLGCGIDICYPPENAKLRHYIIQNGCIISEFALGTKPFVGNFPIRNRIISGLCKGLIVVEAAEKSGTLITVGHALEQGREVMAVPGAINSGLSRGTNYLIKQGASLVSDYKDVLEIIGIEKSQFSNQFKENLKNNKILLEKNEQIIYNTISTDSVSFDFIASKLDMPINKLSSCLIMLEMKGLIKKLPGQKYIRI